LLPDSVSLASFARRVESRRADAGQSATFLAFDDQLHAAAATKGASPQEMRAGEMVASLLMARKARVATPLPDWLLQGFGRATSYRLAPKDKSVLADRKKARLQAKKRNAKDAWDGGLDADETPILQASVAEYIAYVGGAGRFPKFVLGFRPGEGMESRT